MSIKCGHHPGTHETAEEVRICAKMHHESGGQPLVAGEGDVTIPAPGHLKGTSLHQAAEQIYIGPPREQQDTSHPSFPEYVPAPINVTEGIWVLFGDDTKSIDSENTRIIKIQKAVHGTGNLYGKELFASKEIVCNNCGCTPSPILYGAENPCGCNHYDAAEEISHYWEKIVGAVRMLREKDGRKMTLEEAQEFGALYGVCCVCGRTLTDETSIENGIGPVCAGKFS